jgi:peptidoglycan/LPS O-acetylase OafA/YrhL
MDPHLQLENHTYDFFHASRAFRQSSLLTHFWSLAVEEQFYLVWPFIVFFATGARLKRVLLGMLVAGPVIRAVEALVVTSVASYAFLEAPCLRLKDRYFPVRS